MSAREHARSRLGRWLWLATGACACVGTPTPEPPDYAPELLPRPDAGRIFATQEVVSLSQPSEAPLSGPAGSVAPGSEVWIVNLDDTSVPARQTTASASGSFATSVQGAEGDRVRIVSRTDTQHSLPLDTRLVRTSLGSVQLESLPPQQLDCLQVTPADELSTQVPEDRAQERSFTLHNRCSEEAAIDRAALRFGDQGFSLSRAPTRLAPDARATIVLGVAGHADVREHADILLLDVTAGGARGRYALGLWSASSDGTGND